MVSSQIPYVIRPTGESSFGAELFRTTLWRKRKQVIFFERYRGRISYAVDQPEKSKIELVLESASGICRDQSLKPAARTEVTRLLREELLAVAEYPEITFQSEEIKSVGPYRFQVRGPLTLRKIAKPVDFELTLLSAGKERMEVDATGTIRLSDYGIKPPSALMGMKRIQDTVRLRLLLWPERSANG